MSLCWASAIGAIYLIAVLADIHWQRSSSIIPPSLASEKRNSWSNWNHPLNWVVDMWVASFSCISFTVMGTSAWTLLGYPKKGPGTSSCKWNWTVFGPSLSCDLMMLVMPTLKQKRELKQRFFWATQSRSGNFAILGRDFDQIFRQIFSDKNSLPKSPTELEKVGLTF